MSCKTMIRSGIGVAFVAIAFAVMPEMAHADCKDNVRELRQEIKDSGDKYTRDARAEAKKELRQAELTFLKPLECREHLRKARRALRDGKD